MDRNQIINWLKENCQREEIPPPPWTSIILHSGRIGMRVNLMYRPGEDVFKAFVNSQLVATFRPWHILNTYDENGGIEIEI